MRKKSPTLMLLYNTVQLIGAQAITSVLGVLYWGVAARLFSAEAVGFASAAVSAMTLLATIGMLGLGTLLLGELPRQVREHDQRGGTVVASVIVGGSASLGLGLLFGYLSPWISNELGVIAHDTIALLLFAAGCALTSAGFILDQASIGLLRGEIQLWRNSTQALIKLLLLSGLGWYGIAHTGVGIFSTWTIGTALSLLAPVAAFAASGHPWSGLAPRMSFLNKFGREASSHHLLNLALLGPGLLLPVVVTALLTTRVNAYFYVAWMIGAFLFVVPTSLTTVLYAVASGQSNELTSRLRLTLGLSFVFGIVAVVGVGALGGFVLGIFGPSYAVEAGPALTVLAFCVFPVVIRSHYVALARIKSTIQNAAAVFLVGSIIEIALASAGAMGFGLTGLVLGWSIAIALEALYMAPVVWASAKPVG